MTTRDIGNTGEDFTVKYLTQEGYQIIERNYTMRGGEVDIIAEKDEVIAFVEVKSRKVDSMVSGLEAITKSKQLHIIKTAQKYYCETNCKLQPRFDVASVIIQNGIVKAIDYLENAFDVSDTNIIF